MRRISARYVFTGNSFLDKGIVELDDSGLITAVIDPGGILSEQASLEFYDGIIVPGFVNAHCHLELSHMKGMISNKSGRGLPGFIDEIISKRNFPDDLQDKIEKADREMQLNGIVAVGDISNTDDSLSVKKKSKLHYQSFIEVFTVSDAEVDKSFQTAQKIYAKFKANNLPVSLVPHAAYSVPDRLYRLINDFNGAEKRIISVHNQETPGEDELVQKRSGALAKVLADKGFLLDEFSYAGTSALEVNLSGLNRKDNILLIHNTFSTEKDIEFAENFSDTVYWVFCPLSNLYIENTLPDLPMFFSKNIKSCIGTDSYASNTELSVLSELKAIIEKFPEIPFKKLLASATINGAKALGIDDRYGSIEVGKMPGINLISSFDFGKMTLSPNSAVKVLA